jgi:hypothetical protein
LCAWFCDAWFAPNAASLVRVLALHAQRCGDRVRASRRQIRRFAIEIVVREVRARDALLFSSEPYASPVSVDACSPRAAIVSSMARFPVCASSAS